MNFSTINILKRYFIGFILLGFFYWVSFIGFFFVGFGFVLLKILFKSTLKGIFAFPVLPVESDHFRGFVLNLFFISVYPNLQILKLH